MARVAKLTPLDKIQVGDTIYSKVIFNVKQTQAVPPSQQEFIILDDGSEFRFYPDGTIYFRQGTTQPVLLFNGHDWVQNEVLVSGTVSQVYLHADPINGADGDDINSHPHVNYGWFDKSLNPEMSPEFIEKESYENSGMPNEQYLVIVKTLAEMVMELTKKYVDIQNVVDVNRVETALETIEAWANPDMTGWHIDWLRRTGYAEWGNDIEQLWIDLKRDWEHWEQVFERYYVEYCRTHGRPENGRDSYMPDKYMLDYDNLENGKPTIKLNPRYLFYYPDSVLDPTDEEYIELQTTISLMIV